MLVITRREDESLLIGDDIKITVIQAGDGSRQVKLGIEAPDHMLILREELAEENH